MGGQQSREKTIERWLTQPKDLSALLSTGGGLNSHLSIGLFRLAIANQQIGNESLLKTLSKGVGKPTDYIISYFPALVVKQGKEGPEYLECFVVLDQISLLVSCRPAVASGCCAGVDQSFDLRIPLINIDSATLNEANNLSIQYHMEPEGNSTLELRLTNPTECFTKLKCAHAVLHQEGPPPKWKYESVSHLLSPKDVQEKGLSRLFLCYLFTGPRYDLSVQDLPSEWTATLPPMQHVFPEYYGAENKPNIPPPPPKDIAKTRPPALPEYVTLCRSNDPPRVFWCDVPIDERMKFGFPSPYLGAVAEAVSGILCLNHSSIGDPQEINVLKLHGSVYSKCQGTNRDSLSRANNHRPGYHLLPNSRIASGSLVWGTYPRVESVPCNSKIVCALLRTLQHNSWCQVLEFGESFIPETALLDVLPLMRDLCRSNTSLISIAFPPRAADSPPLSPSSPVFKLWAEIGNAIVQNPRPLFTSLDFSNCYLGDEAVRAILPGLKRIFAMRNVLTSVKFSNNHLSGVGVALICESLLGGDTLTPFCSLTELSFGNNPWCSNPNTTPIRQLGEIIKLSPQLQLLNLHSLDENFPIHMIKGELMGSPCPLTELVLGGAKLREGGAYDFVRSVIEISASKSNTLKSVSLRSIALDNAGALEIINSSGPMSVDFSDKGLGTMYQVFLSPQSRITGLSCANNPFYVLHWWTSFPQYLMDLNLSNLELTNHPDIFQPLTAVLAATQTPLSLQSVNISRIVTVPESVVRFLEVCLLCPFIQLKKLDITDCRLGDLVFHCLGHCLRKNRTLTTLKFDGQGASVVGWAAFRGCLYGNKKLIDIPYPYVDVARFFADADQKVADGYAQIPGFKAEIKAAYRAKASYRARPIIDAMVVVKVKYKEWERAIGRTACVLQEIFQSVEQNAKEAELAKQQKKMAKLQSPKAYDMKQKICVKEGKLLLQLVKAIEKHRSKAPDCFSLPWINVDHMIRSTASLFIPRHFNRLVILLGYVFTPAFPDNIIVSIDKCRTYTRELSVKAMNLWDQNLYELATDIMGVAFGPILELRNYQFVAPVKPSTTSYKKKRRVDDDEGDDEYDDEDDANQDDEDKYEENARDRKHKHLHKEKDKDDSDDEGKDDGKDEDGEDDAVEANDDNGDDADDNAGDNLDQNDGKDDDADLNTGLEDVGMYGGAGPQDLPDGGPDDDPSSSAARCTFGVVDNSKTIQRRKTSDIASLVDKCVMKCPTLLLPLEYESSTSYAVLSSSSSPNNTPCTLVTQCSIDRLQQLENQILAWDGALSVSIYIPSTNHNDVVTKVDEFVAHIRTKLFARDRYHIIISLLFGHECESKRQYWDFTSEDEQVPLYPINNLRNLAVAATKSLHSPLLFLVDVDFIPSIGLSSWVTNFSKSIVSRCNSGDIFVVPAFECDSDFSLNSDDIYGTLQEGLDYGFVTPFHVSHFPAGHQPTDYPRWLTSTVETDNLEGHTYPITYHNYYEPYVIMSTNKFVPYDERFRGYGMNKCIHLKALHSNGATFHVIKKHFLMAATHDRSVSHRVTYNPKSKFRRYVIAKLYQIASIEMLTSPSSPCLSEKSNALLSNLHVNSTPIFPFSIKKEILLQHFKKYLASTHHAHASLTKKIPQYFGYSHAEEMNEAAASTDNLEVMI